MSMEPPFKPGQLVRKNSARTRVFATVPASLDSSRERPSWEEW
jgi:hypothetical protein